MKKVEAVILQELDRELGTNIHMEIYQSLAGLVYESDDPEDYRFYDFDGNVIEALN